MAGLVRNCKELIRGPTYHRESQDTPLQRQPAKGSNLKLKKNLMGRGFKGKNGRILKKSFHNARKRVAGSGLAGGKGLRWLRGREKASSGPRQIQRRSMRAMG